MLARGRVSWRILILFAYVLPGIRADDNEYRLMKYLMVEYDQTVRPALNSSEPIEVKFGLALHNIIDVDEKNQILTTNCWLTQVWIDTHLRWNASDFGGLDVVRIPYARVWKPDIILYNNADAQFNQAVINTNVIVKSDGSVTWLSHGIFRSSCDINVEYFPFDIQSCKMKWASWTYDGYQLNLVKLSEFGDTTNYQPNGEFDLVGFDAERHEQFYSCCPEPYPDITYTINMKRRPLFYVFNLILPCILINSIALLVFYVPSESGEKVTLGISALLSMTVFLMTIRESLPPTEKTPLISLYYGVSICLVSFASGMAVVTLNIHHRGLRGIAVPKLLKLFVLDWVAKILLVKFGDEKLEKTNQSRYPSTETSASIISVPASSYSQPTLTQVGEKLSQVRRRKSRTARKCYCSAKKVSVAQNGGTLCSCPKLVGEKVPRASVPCMEPGIMLDSSKAEKFCTPDNNFGGVPVTSPRFGPKRQHSVSNGDQFEDRVSNLLLRVASAIERSEARMTQLDSHDAVQLEWKKVALVCDRSLLIVFFLITAIATCMILFSSPYGP